MSKSQRNKLLCLLNYFERIRKSEEAGEEEFLSMCVSVSRRGLDPADAKGELWIGCEKKLVPFESQAGDLIENAHGCLQVDFANEYIGGGVLGMGCVQVRIALVWCIVAMVSPKGTHVTQNLTSSTSPVARPFSPLLQGTVHKLRLFPHTSI